MGQMSGHDFILPLSTHNQENHHETHWQQNADHRRHVRHRPPTAQEFHKLGNKVIITGRRQALVDEVTGANPGMKGYMVDVDHAKSIIDFAAKITAEHPDLNFCRTTPAS
jgi:tetrahydrodipicolinate N-succinyltransferase